MTAATDKPAKCRFCKGLGYLLCDCWPGDCICGQGDETCDECNGTGEDDPGWDDFEDWDFTEEPGQ